MTTSRKTQGNKRAVAAEPVDPAMKPIQFRVPEHVFEAFSEQAGHEFGFSKGAKSQLFLKLWTEYQAKNS